MKERAGSFLKQAEASIRAARHLLEQGDYAGFVVSRSYYSMFLIMFLTCIIYKRCDNLMSK